MRGAGCRARFFWKGFRMLMSPQYLPRWRVAYVRGDARRAGRRHAQRDAASTSPSWRGRARASPSTSSSRAPRRPARRRRAAPPPRAASTSAPTPRAARRAWCRRRDARICACVDGPAVASSAPAARSGGVDAEPRGAICAAPARRSSPTRAPGPACFALDERLADHVAWLAAQGITPGAVCTVYTFGLPGAPKPAPWVHLATSEI